MTIKWILPTSFPKFTYNPMGLNFNYQTFNANSLRNFPIFHFNTMPFLSISTFKSPLLSLTSGYKKTSSSVRLNSGNGNDIVSTANKYLGFNERDNSYKLFTNGRTEAWCADFVTHVVKESCQKSGKTLPSGFGSSSVEGLRQWGKNNGCYLQTAGSANKSELIAQNVKKGDVIIFKENGKSHTGIVSDIANGKIYTTEGNTSDKVAQRSYSINDSSISGFVQLA